MSMNSLRHHAHTKPTIYPYLLFGGFKLFQSDMMSCFTSLNTLSRVTLFLLSCYCWFNSRCLGLSKVIKYLHVSVRNNVLYVFCAFACSIVELMVGLKSIHHDNLYIICFTWEPAGAIRWYYIPNPMVKHRVSLTVPRHSAQGLIFIYSSWCLYKINHIMMETI
jgi:hypothetical protein